MSFDPADFWEEPVEEPATYPRCKPSNSTRIGHY
jgi:hypothetical protein